MSRRRVLLMATRLAVGGAQRHMLDLARRLPRDRWAVEVLAGPDTGTEGSLQEAFVAADVPVHLLPGLRREGNTAADATTLWRLIGFLRRGRYDVVHTHQAKAGVLGRFAAGYAKPPCVVHTVHGWPWHNALDRATRERYIGYERRVAAKADRIVLVSERDRGKGLAQKIAPVDRFTLIRAGIDLAEFDPDRFDRLDCRRALGIADDARVVISVGALTPQKNPLEALEVVARARHAFPDLQYLVVGDGPLRAEAERRAEELGLGEGVRFLGLRDDVPALLAAADVFLLTSLWEGLPRTLLEAMAMGKAVVATQVDGVLDVIEDNVTGYVRDPGDIDELTAMLVRLFRAPNLITDMRKGNTAFLRKPEFSVERTVDQVAALYESILQAKGGRS
jgi:glycosyltransferase involved in cell wall biosynthesis